MDFKDQVSELEPSGSKRLALGREGNGHSWVNPQWNLFIVSISGVGTCPPLGTPRY